MWLRKNCFPCYHIKLFFWWQHECAYLKFLFVFKLAQIILDSKLAPFSFTHSSLLVLRPCRPSVLTGFKCPDFGNWSLSTHNCYCWLQCMDLIYAAFSSTSTSCMSQTILAAHIFNLILYPIQCFNTRTLPSILPLVFIQV